MSLNTINTYRYRNPILYLAIGLGAIFCIATGYSELFVKSQPIIYVLDILLILTGIAMVVGIALFYTRAWITISPDKIAYRGVFDPVTYYHPSQIVAFCYDLKRSTNDSSVRAFIRFDDGTSFSIFHGMSKYDALVEDILDICPATAKISEGDYDNYDENNV